MSTSSRRGRVRGSDAGFSLIEIVVAMGLLAVVLTASLPMFLSMMRATVTTKLQTQAKNLSQERLEALRNMRFHVARQNGPFLDLLDVYYTNATSSEPPTTVTLGADQLKGKYFASGSGPGGTPVAPFYRVQIDALQGAPTYSQTIVSQFLGPDGLPLPASRFQDVYDSQIAGKDDPPSLVLGVSVVTTWQEAGKSKSFRTFTRITEGRPALPVIQSQAKAVAVDVTSTAIDGTTLKLQSGIIGLDGAQSTGSSVAGYVGGALATRTGTPSISGRVGQFSLPAQAATVTGDSTPKDGGGCSWYAFGPTQVANVTASVSSGLPKAPTNVDAPSVVTGEVRGGSGNACGLLSFDNSAGGGLVRPLTDLLGAAMGPVPYVRVNDDVSGTPGISGSGYVTATPASDSPHQVRSGTAASMDRPVVLFPNSPDVAGETASTGLVSAQLSSASVDCVSGGASTAGTVRGKYQLQLRWWGRLGTETLPQYRSAAWTYDSDLAATPQLVAGSAAWDPANTFLSNGQTLASVVQLNLPSATSGVVTTGASSGLRGFPGGIMTLTTAGTLLNESGVGHSAIKVQLGQLSCVADDLR